MALTDRLRRVIDEAAARAVDALAARRGVALPGGPQDLSLQASIPNPFGGAPLAQLRVRLTTERHAHGETLRLRAHLQGRLDLPEPARAALPGPGQGSTGALVPRAQRVAAGLLRRGLESGLARRLTPYLERRFESWVDLQAATAPLDQGAQALVPDSVQLLGLGRTPALRLGEQSQVETWVGRCTGEHSGVAQVTLLQFSEPTGPGRRQRGRKPLHVAASVATFYEDPRRRH
jgi:hypothetical protein